MNFIYMIVVGAIAGFLAGQIFQGYGFGFVGNIAVGIVGAIIGGVLFGNFFFGGLVLIGQIISATLGAVILLFVISLVKR